MRRTVYSCDKCGKEIEPQEAEIYEVYCHDFCEECAGKLENIIKNWLAPEKEIVKVEIKLDKTEAKPKKPKEAKKTCKIDWDKACALKLAGWNNKDIADEIHANEGTINAMIYSKLKKYQEGERENGEGRSTEEDSEELI